MQKKLVVVGGGAAGFFCAINAAKENPKLQVTIVEKNNKVLSKVRISGGGRCNVTHACFDINELSTKYPRGQKFVKKAFHWFNTNHTIEWFAQRGVELKTEMDGRMFPLSNTSETIINCLLQEATKYNIDLKLSCDITHITKKENKFVLTSPNEIFNADFVCIACGGFPKTSQFDWLTNIGHTIEEPVPSLFTFNMPNNNITSLMGISVSNVNVKIVGSKLQTDGALLITHWGFSGPAVLKLSAWAARELALKKYEFQIAINWLGNITEQNLRDQINDFRETLGSAKVASKNPFELPTRLWQYFLLINNIPENWRWADLPTANKNKLIQTLIAQNFTISGKTTFKEEFVTSGGIQLNEIDVNTMESKKVANLFFSGEIMNVDGITGGFNFQHAWTSGWIAAKAIAEKARN